MDIESKDNNSIPISYSISRSHREANYSIHNSCSALQSVITTYLDNDAECITLVDFLRKKLVTLNHRKLLKNDPTGDNNCIFHCGFSFLTQEERRSVEENYYRKHKSWYGLPPSWAAEFEKKIENEEKKKEL